MKIRVSIIIVNRVQTTMNGGQILSRRETRYVNLKAKASCRRPQNIEKCKNIKHVKNENRQKHVILEGFSQNG